MLLHPGLRLSGGLCVGLPGIGEKQESVRHYDYFLPLGLMRNRARHRRSMYQTSVCFRGFQSHSPCTGTRIVFDKHTIDRERAAGCNYSKQVHPDTSNHVCYRYSDTRSWCQPLSIARQEFLRMRCRRLFRRRCQESGEYQGQRLYTIYAVSLSGSTKERGLHSREWQ